MHPNIGGYFCIHRPSFSGCAIFFYSYTYEKSFSELNIFYSTICILFYKFRKIKSFFLYKLSIKVLKKCLTVILSLQSTVRFYLQNHPCLII